LPLSQTADHKCGARLLLLTVNVPSHEIFIDRLHGFDVVFILLLCSQASSRFSEGSGVLSPPIGFTVSVEPSPVTRQSSAELMLATHSPQVPSSICQCHMVVDADTNSPFTCSSPCYIQNSNHHLQPAEAAQTINQSINQSSIKNLKRAICRPK